MKPQESDQERCKQLRKMMSLVWGCGVYTLNVIGNGCICHDVVGMTGVHDWGGGGVVGTVEQYVTHGNSVLHTILAIAAKQM